MLSNQHIQMSHVEIKNQKCLNRETENYKIQADTKILKNITGKKLWSAKCSDIP